MKFTQSLLSLSICILFVSCNSPASKQTTPTAATQDAPAEDTETRPKEQTAFLTRVKAESDFSIGSNAAQKDDHIAAFNKYAKDSLKKITNWEMLVTNVNDNSLDESSFAKAMFGSNEVYNLVLVCPIKIDKTVDTIAMDNRVNFTYTIPKSPTSEGLKKQLAIIKSLDKNDAVIVSGSLTHLDGNMKVNFEEFFNSYQPWNVDLLITDIRKKK